MCVIFHMDQLLNGNIIWQDAVKLVNKLLLIPQSSNVTRSIKMCIKHFGMNACICSSAACYFNLFTGQRMESLMELFLHRMSIGLKLPAVIVFSKKGESEEIACHIKAD